MLHKVKNKKKKKKNNFNNYGEGIGFIF